MGRVDRMDKKDDSREKRDLLRATKEKLFVLLPLIGNGSRNMLSSGHGMHVTWHLLSVHVWTSTQPYRYINMLNETITSRSSSGKSLPNLGHMLNFRIHWCNCQKAVLRGCIAYLTSTEKDGEGAGQGWFFSELIGPMSWKDCSLVLAWLECWREKTIAR